MIGAVVRFVHISFFDFVGKFLELLKSSVRHARKYLKLICREEIIKLEFEVDVDKMQHDIDTCGLCSECYVEQIWRDKGDSRECHCGKTKKAFNKSLLHWNDEHMGGTDLPMKDAIACITLKNGKRICAQLFYDEEEKPCMWYDDFDNWYSMNDVESWRYICGYTGRKIKMKVDT